MLAMAMDPGGKKIAISGNRAQQCIRTSEKEEEKEKNEKCALSASLPLTAKNKKKSR